MFALVYPNQDNNSRRYEVKRYYLPKLSLSIITSWNGKNLYDQPINSNIKRNKEIRNLTTGQGENYTTVCLLADECIKNHYRLIVVDLIWQTELHAGWKAIQEIEFVGQLKIVDGVNADGRESSFRKNKRKWD